VQAVVIAHARSEPGNCYIRLADFPGLIRLWRTLASKDAVAPCAAGRLGW
jgi:hypothetical protein